MAIKRTPNQIEFDKQINRIKKILKNIQKDTGIEIEFNTPEKPKRVSRQRITELKKITPKFIKTELEKITKPVKVDDVKSTSKKTPIEREKRARNYTLEAIIRASKRTVNKKPSQRSKTTSKRKDTPIKQIDNKTLIKEGEIIIDKIYETLYDWVFNIDGAHAGYEDVKKADRDLVWAIIGRARAELGDEQVALNIRNSSADVEGIINRIIYGSDETTVKFDIAELSRIANGRSLTIDESKYLTELFENRTFIEFDEEDFESDNPYFATLKGYDEV